jgi:DNA-binding transcriptional ArsR family regulator
MFDQAKEKALKITEALYRTTELFSDAEPLKWSLRQTALEVLNAAPQDLVKIDALVKGLLLKLELASNGTFISKMNFDVLRREYSNLLSQLMSYRESYQALLDNIVSDIKSPAISDKKEETAEVASKDGSVERKSAVYQNKNTDRRNVVLAKLKESGPSSVGDIVGAFGNSLSEKTVQRELNALVISGAVKKEGEKRWRRYFI